MTELALRDDRLPELISDRADVAVARLQSWAQAASATHQMATTLVQTSFVPQAFRNKPMEATAAILAGAEVGLNPMASLRSFDVIQGTAAPRANTLRAIVQSMGHQIRLVESTDTRAIVEGCRRGETTWQRSIWTIDRAKKLNLTGKDNWKNQPQAMLVARATAECARLIASDAIHGIAYTVEELTDDASPDAVEEARPPKRTVKRAPKPEAVAPAEPELETETADPEATSEMVTDDQLTMMHTMFTALGIAARETRLEYAARVVGRPLGSSKELTKTEARRVINALDADASASREAIEAEPDFEEPSS